MKKSEATEKFNHLYDATYDDAVVFIAGKSGRTDILDDVLTETYSEIYKYLLSIKIYDIESIRKFFFNCLKSSISKHAHKSNGLKVTTETEYKNVKESEKLIDLMLETEIGITENQALDALLIKKVNAYLTHKSDFQRRAFILRFFYGYEARQISELLGVSEAAVNGSIYSILEEIRDNFLGEYVEKRGN